MNKYLKAMSDYTIASRYARYLPEKKRRTTWEEQVGIVKEMHLERYPQAKTDIEWAFDYVMKKRVLGSQRALQFGGDPIRKKHARIYNCTSSYADRPRFFQEAFWLLLCGCGVGFSIQKHHVEKLPEIVGRTSRKYHAIENENLDSITYVIPDTIEGWSDSLGVLLSSYFVENQPFPEYFGKKIKFVYSKIRKKGAPLASGVGKAPGPDGLKNALEKIENLLDSIIGNSDAPKKLKPINVYDIVMHSSDAVLSGGVRRSATLALFSADDDEMSKAKTGNWKIVNPQRARSNNSVLLIRDKTSFEDFRKLIENVKEHGEPGFVWSDNLELLINPCVEIGFTAYETFEDEETGFIKRHPNGEPIFGKSGWNFCNLCEINGRKIKSEEDFENAAKAAAIIGTLQAGYTNFDYLGEITENIVRREALLGVSITGMMDNHDVIFDKKLQKKMAKIVLDENERIADLIGINHAARVSCIKPSGSSSLVLGTSSGIHPHHAKRYFRRIQANKEEAPLQWFKKHNPLAVEESVWSENDTDEIVTFCVEVEQSARTKNQIDAIGMLEHVKSTQQNWVMNGMRKERCIAPWIRHNVSNTIHIKDDEWENVTKYIYDNRKYFAGISLMALHGDKDYQQAPNCKIYFENEILKEYGVGSMFASGLIVDGLHYFEDNLWNACDAALGTGIPIYIEELRNAILNNNDSEKYVGLNAHDSNEKLEEWLKKEIIQIEDKRDWIRRAKQFANRYFENDLKKMTYCLKDVNNLKLWHDLQREYKEVDYSKLYEDSDETKLEEAMACADGKCHLQLAI